MLTWGSRSGLPEAQSQCVVRLLTREWLWDCCSRKLPFWLPCWPLHSQAVCQQLTQFSRLQQTHLLPDLLDSRTHCLNSVLTFSWTEQSFFGHACHWLKIVQWRRCTDVESHLVCQALPRGAEGQCLDHSPSNPCSHYVSLLLCSSWYTPMNIYHRLEEIFLTSGSSRTCSKHMWVWKLHPTKIPLHSVLVTRILREVVSDPPITEAHSYFQSQCLVISTQQSCLG